MDTIFWLSPSIESCNWIDFISVAYASWYHWNCGRTQRKAATINQFACPSYSLYVQLLWYPMYYPGGMKARVSPVQWSKPHSILASTPVMFEKENYFIIFEEGCRYQNLFPNPQLVGIRCDIWPPKTTLGQTSNPSAGNKVTFSEWMVMMIFSRIKTWFFILWTDPYTILHAWKWAWAP